MDPIKTAVSCCCVWKGGRVMYTYTNGGDQEMENLAALCLEMTPPYHRWYFQTMGKKTFGFFMDDGYVYFAIVNQSLSNSQVLRFLQKLRDEYRTIGKKGSTRSVSSLNSLCLQEQLLPVVRHLITSLEHAEWPAEHASPCNTANGHVQGGASTKAPLLGKPTKQEKKKMKDHAITIRDIEMNEHRRSTDGGGKTDSDSQGTSASPLQQDSSSTRSKSNSQMLRKKWCYHVRIILAIDVAVCVILFVIWLVICHGIECIR